MGLSDLPYLKFLPWSALGGILRSVYTCALAYWVGSTIEDYPLSPSSSPKPSPRV